MLPSIIIQVLVAMSGKFTSFRDTAVLVKKIRDVKQFCPSIIYLFAYFNLVCLLHPSYENKNKII